MFPVQNVTFVDVAPSNPSSEIEADEKSRNGKSQSHLNRFEKYELDASLKFLCVIGVMILIIVDLITVS